MNKREKNPPAENLWMDHGRMMREDADADADADADVDFYNRRARRQTRM